MKKPKTPGGAYVKYGSMAFEFFAACLVGVFLGKWLDARLGFERPVWAVFFTVGFMLAALYSVYKKLLKD